MTTSLSPLVLHLRALCFAIWTAISPLAPQAPDAGAIAQAIAETVAADADPVFGDRDLEAAVDAYYAFRESRLRRAPKPGDGGKSFGAWQEQSEAGRRDLRTQAAYWLELLHWGARACPASPAAPLSGGCLAARALADRRVDRATELLVQVTTGALADAH